MESESNSLGKPVNASFRLPQIHRCSGIELRYFPMSGQGTCYNPSTCLSCLQENHTECLMLRSSHNNPCVSKNFGNALVREPSDELNTILELELAYHCRQPRLVPACPDDRQSNIYREQGHCFYYKIEPLVRLKTTYACDRKPVIPAFRFG